LDRETPDLDSLYRDVVLDHYRSPRGRENLANPDVVNQGVNPLCGDEVLVALKMDGGRIGKVHVHGRGCSISTASGSMMAETLAGKSREEADRILAIFRDLMRGNPPPAGADIGDLDALAGVHKFPVRIKCALLPWTTLADALNAYDSGTAKPESHSSTETIAGDGGTSDKQKLPDIGKAGAR
jgi:nitrogen fixation NifU-like protein